MDDLAAVLRDARAQLVRDLALLRLVKHVKVAAPAAGAEWTQVVPGGVVWEIMAVQATLVTDATVATRDPHVTIDDGTTIYTRTIARNGVAASLTAQLAWYRDAGAFGADVATTGMVNTIYSGPLLAGDRIKSLTTSMVAGDAYSGVIVTVREWSEAAMVDVSRYAATTLAEQAAARAWSGSPAA